MLDDLARRIVDWGTSGTIDRRAAALQATLGNPQTAIDMGAQAVRTGARGPAVSDIAHLGASAGEAAVAPFRATAVFSTVLAGIFVGAVAAFVYRRREQS